MESDAVLIEWVRPYDLQYVRQREYVEKYSRQILCFDLDEIKVHSALDCIDSIQMLAVEEPQIIVPCVMALYSSGLEDEHIVSLTDAGAILYEKPPGVETPALIEDLKDQIASAHMFFEPNPEAADEEPLAESLLHGDEAEMGYDLEVFTNPPYQLDEESFKRLENRMRMKDSDWRKDD